MRKFATQDKSGTLSPIEWLEVVKLMGIHVSDNEAAEMFETVDTDKDGNISLAEFVKYMGS